MCVCEIEGERKIEREMSVCVCVCLRVPLIWVRRNVVKSVTGPSSKQNKDFHHLLQSLYAPKIVCSLKIICNYCYITHISLLYSFFTWDNRKEDDGPIFPFFLNLDQNCFVLWNTYMNNVVKLAILNSFVTFFGVASALMFNQILPSFSLTEHSLIFHLDKYNWSDISWKHLFLTLHSLVVMSHPTESVHLHPHRKAISKIGHYFNNEISECPLLPKQCQKLWVLPSMPDIRYCLWYAHCHDCGLAISEKQIFNNKF